MLTGTEKGYLVMTLVFLAAGSGIKAYRNTSIRLGPFPGPSAALLGASAPPSGTDTLKKSPMAPAFGDSSHANPPVPASGDTASPEGNGTVPGPEGSGALDGRSVREPAMAGSGHRAGKSAFSGKVDINHADERELTSVRGLGEKTAKAIVQYRKAHGPYRRLRDLLQVKGIGEKKLEKLGPYLIL